MPRNAHEAQLIREFVVLISHGDERHRRWLFNAGEAFINREPIPACDETSLLPVETLKLPIGGSNAT